MRSIFVIGTIFYWLTCAVSYAQRSDIAPYFSPMRPCIIQVFSSGRLRSVDKPLPISVGQIVMIEFDMSKLAMDPNIDPIDVARYQDPNQLFDANFSSRGMVLLRSTSYKDKNDALRYLFVAKAVREGRIDLSLKPISENAGGSQPPGFVSGTTIPLRVISGKSYHSEIRRTNIRQFHMNDLLHDLTASPGDLIVIESERPKETVNGTDDRIFRYEIPEVKATGLVEVFSEVSQKIAVNEHGLELIGGSKSFRKKTYFLVTDRTSGGSLLIFKPLQAHPILGNQTPVIERRISVEVRPNRPE